MSTIEKDIKIGYTPIPMSDEVEETEMFGEPDDEPSELDFNDKELSRWDLEPGPFDDLDDDDLTITDDY